MQTYQNRILGALDPRPKNSPMLFFEETNYGISLLNKMAKLILGISTIVTQYRREETLWRENDFASLSQFLKSEIQNRINSGIKKTTIYYHHEAFYCYRYRRHYFLFCRGRYLGLEVF